MTNDDQPGYSGLDLMAGASAAIERAPELAHQIRTLVQRLASRGGEIDATDDDVQGLIALIERAGVPSPPLRDSKPRGQYGPTADYGDAP